MRGNKCRVTVRPKIFSHSGGPKMGMGGRTRDLGLVGKPIEGGPIGGGR